jgi:hypothetical protein
LKYRNREVLFREAILTFLGVETGTEEKRKCTAKQKELCQAQHGIFLDWACKNCEKN